MERFTGQGASPGIAVGPAAELADEGPAAVKKHVDDIDAEEKRFWEAQSIAAAQIEKIRDKALKSAGEHEAGIFDAHRMLLMDEAFTREILDTVRREAVNAEYAAALACDKFSAVFSRMDDEYMRERAADVRDVAGRLIKVLGCGGEEQNIPEVPSIIIADDLSPSQTIQLERKNVLAFVTRRGSSNSHTAILARTMGIPAVVGAEVPAGAGGRMAVVDGSRGSIVLDPDEETLEKAERLKRAAEDRRKELSEYKSLPAVTRSGKKIRVMANIGSLSDIDAAIQNGAEGIGLFRSEFLYLEGRTCPSEEEQFLAYREAAGRMDGKKVIIRTMDIGADKQADYLEMDREENPALGCRAVRISLTREDIFKTQLRALYRASVYGNIAVMVPMIISVWEVKRVREVMGEVRKELEKEDIPFRNMELGIMVETPAAALTADDLAAESDFFSIGTNDLTQYTLALDRQNAKLERFYDPYHPAVMRLLKMTCDAAHKAGIWVGICGELAANVKMTEKLIGMGIDEMSAAPGMILEIKKAICESR